MSVPTSKADGALLSIAQGRHRHRGREAAAVVAYVFQLVDVPDVVCGLKHQASSSFVFTKQLQHSRIARPAARSHLDLPQTLIEALGWVYPRAAARVRSTRLAASATAGPGTHVIGWIDS